MNNFPIFLTKLSIILLVPLVFISCGEKKQQAPPPPEIPVVEVLIKDVPIYKEFVGQVYGSFDIPIRARVSGFLEGIHFSEGLRVNKGQLLYTIDPQPLQAQVAIQESQLAEAKTSLAKAESDLNRIKPLAEINAVSKSDLDAAQAQYDAAIAYVSASESSLRYANINLGYCWMRSPIGGLIGKTQAKVGEFVGKEPNPVILNTVSTIDTVYVEFYLTEADYLVLAREKIEEYKKRDLKDIKRRENEKKDLRIILADGSTFKHKGFVNFIDSQVDPTTGSLLVQSSFPNPDQLLRPGQYAKVKAKMDDIIGGLLVPQRCVMELQGLYSVYIVNDSSKVETRQVVTGEKIGDLWLIKSGLKAGDKIVIDALQKVTPGLEIKPVITEFKSQFNPQ